MLSDTAQARQSPAVRFAFGVTRGLRGQPKSTFLREIATMIRCDLTRRNFLAACAAPALASGTSFAGAAESFAPGSQRLSLAQLHKWESLQYGMFIHFGMSTFVQNELPDGKAPVHDLCSRSAERRPMGLGGSRRGHEVHRADHQARRRPLPVAEQVHRLHGGQQREQDQRGGGVLQVVRQAGRSARLLLLLLGQPQPLRQQDAFRRRPVGAK